VRIEANGLAIFKVIETGELIHVKPAELDWNNESDGEERGMGEELIHSAELEIGGHSVAWKIYEYPIGIENYKKTEFDDEVLDMIQDFDYWLEHEPED